MIFSEDIAPIEWSETERLKLEFGSKAAFLATIPRRWTPPFALVPASALTGESSTWLAPSKADVARLTELAGKTGRVYVRSSVVRESIWDRGSYESVIVDLRNHLETSLNHAISQVLASAAGKQTGMVIQSFVQPRARGEFGNLLRISKTRDHWELSSDTAETSSRIRFNAQRDEAADPRAALQIRPGQSRERLFGSVAAWLNNCLLRGRSHRVNCEWVADYHCIYIVQLDEEDEDFLGVNPFQIRVTPAHRSHAASGAYLSLAEGEAIKEWDKLVVLDELRDSKALYRPMLFWVPMSALPRSDDAASLTRLEEDFRELIGPDNIVVRTSVRAGGEKPPNLKCTEGLMPAQAAKACLNIRDDFARQFGRIDDFAFVAHRFIAARACAWVHADPESPLVEIHSLWGLPDALQYCPYDIWEVHLPTEVATDYPEYKSHMLIAREDGKWEYARIKNELRRSLSIGRRDAMDLAARTADIAERLGKKCHVMWFVGCLDPNGAPFNIPWYWTPAHRAERNVDRSNYRSFVIGNQKDLETFKGLPGSKARHALTLAPYDHTLMRDMKFISAVGATAKESGVPVILAGSTLAHAYFALRRQGCTIVTRGEKDHSRVRRHTTFGKIVRDKIPARIAERREAEITRKIPTTLRKGFLTGKLLEEALEVRRAQSPEDKKVELADLYEVIRALAKTDGFPMEEIVRIADDKRSKAGGFDEGLVLVQTGLVGQDRQTIHDTEGSITQVLARKLSGSAYELPFTFFGFMDLDQPRSLNFEDLGIRLDVTLKGDRIELQASREAEQLDLSLELATREAKERE